MPNDKPATCPQCGQKFIPAPTASQSSSDKAPAPETQPITPAAARRLTAYDEKRLRAKNPAPLGPSAGRRVKGAHITINVMGGCVTDVFGLPPGWTYEVNDQD